MFEKYTDAARRSIFFARYEASHFGSRQIEPAHLLSGIMRVVPELVREWIGDDQSIGRLRSALEEQQPRSAEKIPTSVDLPLSDASKRILAFGAEEAERLAHPCIDAAHLFLGILREHGPAAEGLAEGAFTPSPRASLGISACHSGKSRRTMLKADLMAEVSRIVQTTKKESEVVVEAIFDGIARSLSTGDKVEIRGFGSFRTRQRQPRIVRNPRTGVRVGVPAKRISYFKPSKELKELVNKAPIEH